MQKINREALKAALSNAVKPNYDICTTCPHCGKEGITNNGEWLLWCGDKEHAEALLQAAAILLEITGEDWEVPEVIHEARIELR